ncbi:hypothetical protein XENTR_v10001279 [Xenopus tropicalis]|uniref:UPF0449 protein C19orf25 homolog n=2 Tax=Xenopus tropicalis TaxID=8364 RepID=CS025_XENTR|nr:UPF0449 protein C19orf25 homolog [Xenopus tropicalis]XP_012819843.1 UPF0449 protein C19orf25 homolog isoform X1 [Xenopus tropicalis]XP_031757117.1 UPF0449 protein C19orf25 homolog isoform X1 [Xenopus tropicalis]Q28C26.1 RecName: Full=UPF0449 protein C19orf25 homolog [Xenopus tropicalis]KAE8631699.1 hypothetical protein XENTR_v10001279 [Xenopus tropicalis]CAJ82336.1 novel protein [Xenopus tropicalis]|eukprot:XP_012819843.1 PREDICTED: UPF0449 protein C19orf25 homolog isoform X1 [Xenopus tropicalis]
MTSRAKKRIVLPTRPEPPSIEQILQDVHGAIASDPVFICDFSDDSSLSNNATLCEKEKQYWQSCNYVDMNNKLKEALIQLKAKCDVLRSAGEKLEEDIENLREATM